MIPVPDAGEIEGDLRLPGDAPGLVVFAHGSGSSRHSPRNRMVAPRLNEAGFGTLLVDLLTSEEEAVDVRTAHLRFDLGLLADRLLAAGDAVAAEAGGRDPFCKRKNEAVDGRLRRISRLSSRRTRPPPRSGG